MNSVIGLSEPKQDPRNVKGDGYTYKNEFNALIKNAMHARSMNEFQ